MATQPAPKHKINYLAFMKLMPSLLQFAENIHGPGNGASKLQTVTNLAQAALRVSADAGLIPQSVSDNVPQIVNLAEMTLSSMKSTGALKPAATNTAEAANTPQGFQETTPMVD